MGIKKGYVFGINDEYQHIFQKDATEELREYLKEAEERKKKREQQKKHKTGK